MSSDSRQLDIFEQRIRDLGNRGDLDHDQKLELSRAIERRDEILTKQLLPPKHEQERVKLYLQPISLREANALISRWHRHHQPDRGCHFCIAVNDGENIRGVAIIGRPNARRLQDGYTAEVTRVATDGAPNACSMLYGAAWRAAKAIGYRRLVTYTLPEEGGGSLRGASFHLIGQAGGGSWSRKGRPRVDLHPTQTKLRWEKTTDHA